MFDDANETCALAEGYRRQADDAEGEVEAGGWVDALLADVAVEDPPELRARF